MLWVFREMREDCVYLQSNDGPLYIPSQTIPMRGTIDREILQSLLSREEEEESSCILVVGVVLAFFFDFFYASCFCARTSHGKPFVSHLFSLAFQLVFYVRVFEVCIRM